MESMIVSRGEINDDLVEIVFWMHLKILSKLRVTRFSRREASLFPATEKSLERIVNALDLLDQAVLAFSKVKDLSISRRYNRFRVHIYWSNFWTNRATEEAVQRGVKPQIWLDSFFYIDSKGRRIGAVDRFSEKDRDGRVTENPESF